MKDNNRSNDQLQRSNKRLMHDESTSSEAKRSRGVTLQHQEPAAVRQASVKALTARSQDQELGGTMMRPQQDEQPAAGLDFQGEPPTQLGAVERRSKQKNQGLLVRLTTEAEALQQQGTALMAVIAAQRNRIEALEQDKKLLRQDMGTRRRPGIC